MPEHGNGPSSYWNCGAIIGHSKAYRLFETSSTPERRRLRKKATKIKIKGSSWAKGIAKYQNKSPVLVDENESWVSVFETCISQTDILSCSITIFPVAGLQKLHQPNHAEKASERRTSCSTWRPSTTGASSLKISYAFLWNSSWAAIKSARFRSGSGVSRTWK